MTPWTIFLLVLAAIMVAVTYGVWWVRYGDSKRQRDTEKQNSDALAVGVRTHGWRHESFERGDIKYQVSGTPDSGVAWTLQYDANHRSDTSTPRLTFEVDWLGSGANEWHIEDRPIYEMTQKTRSQGGDYWAHKKCSRRGTMAYV